jgi:hypothetical protein
MAQEQEFKEALESYLLRYPETKEPAENDLYETLNQAKGIRQVGGKKGLAEFLQEQEEKAQNEEEAPKA